MKSRRDFLKIAAVTAAGLGLKTPCWAAMPTGPVKEIPGPDALKGERWAIVIDTRKFNEELFEKCIQACHQIHNVPDFGDEKEIKWIWKDTYEHTFPYQDNPYQSQGVKDREFLLLCNHCEHPPCVRVCPTKATFQREDGVVMMDFHRCIGCRYCMAGCPYGARSFNYRDPRLFFNGEEQKLNMEFPTRGKGVVEKCNFCYERLMIGQIPACVEVSEGAMLFGDLADPKSEVSRALKENYTIRRKPSLGTYPNVFYII
ncbi:MAG: sulfate reduction electron transfer complex DsrMKJOP subunit DsrO [Desulfovibrionales bacterium]